MTIPGQWHNDAFPASLPASLEAKKLTETEIVEFSLGDHVCGAGVAQVREIIRTAGGIVPVTGGHPSILGVVNLRGKIIPVIDLAKHFHITGNGDFIELPSIKQDSKSPNSVDESNGKFGAGIERLNKKKRVIVSEFYRFRVGFLVHQVTRILRVSSPQPEVPRGGGAFGRPIIEFPAQPPQPWGNYLRGIVHSEGRTISLLDLEEIALGVHPVDRTRPKERAALPPTGHRSPEGEEPLAIPRVDFDRSTKKILVVEDSAFMRQMIARYLKQAGYNVLTVSNGHEAWEVLADILLSPDFTDIARHYHLILTDIEMPGMDGLELIQKVKEHPAFKKLPCVVFSGSLIDDLSAKCRAAGADALISKDDIERLIRLLDSKVIV